MYWRIHGISWRLRMPGMRQTVRAMQEHGHIVQTEREREKASRYLWDNSIGDCRHADHRKRWKQVRWLQSSGTKWDLSEEQIRMEQWQLPSVDVPCASSGPIRTVAWCAARNWRCVHIDVCTSLLSLKSCKRGFERTRSMKDESHILSPMIVLEEHSNCHGHEQIDQNNDEHNTANQCQDGWINLKDETESKDEMESFLRRSLSNGLTWK